ncbi:MAG TPA: reverse transcriptase domain-containing protein [Tepidisphaeraceae bacterium]|nr:reverse transcriptase domain-containing protein [Tepidisphaeraceae bacterium]
MSLIPPEKLQKLQAALHAKAKASPDQRFHALYDKVYRKDVLEHAYDCCRANGGVEGADGQTFEDIKAYGLDRWLGELAEELKVKTYRPSPVRRVWIPKPDGKKRPLGIPTIKDRVAQTAAMLVLQPIFEADLQGEQYAYRPQRSALHAVNQVRELLISGHTQVVDADLSGYFDSIPHAELMQCLRRRIVDGVMLHLLKMWLEAGGPRGPSQGPHRQLRRRLCDLLPGHGPGSHDRHAGHDEAAEADGERIINSHVRYRFGKWWLAKHKGARLHPRWRWSPWLEQTFGLLQLKWDPSRLPRANA